MVCSKFWVESVPLSSKQRVKVRWTFQKELGEHFYDASVGGGTLKESVPAQGKSSKVVLPHLLAIEVRKSTASNTSISEQCRHLSLLIG